MQQEELRFDLSTPIEYSVKGSGDLTSGDFILLKAPSHKNTKECSKLKQAFFRSLPTETPDPEVVEKAREARRELQGEDEDDDVTFSGEEVIILIAKDKNVELAEFLDVAKKLLTSGSVAEMEGETKLTHFMVDKMSYDDFERLTGEYVANFILASSVAAMNAKRSKQSATS